MSSANRGGQVDGRGHAIFRFPDLGEGNHKAAIQGVARDPQNDRVLDSLIKSYPLNVAVWH